jgi:hypothetical protein
MKVVRTTLPFLLIVAVAVTCMPARSLGVVQFLGK